MTNRPGTVATIEIDALFRRIDGAREDIVALTRDLIRFPTINPPGDAYEACARFLGDRLSARGANVEYIRGLGEPDDSDLHPRLNVIARFEAGAPGPSIHINGHIDVVEPGLGWTLPPFEGVIRDGRVYGRGACDMKGGIAAGIIAIEALLAQGLLTHGALEFSGTVDEESGGFGGVGYLARKGYFDRSRVDHVIIPEPLNPDRVCLGHRGVWWAEVEITGQIGHGAMPFLGVSAISGMGDFLNLIERELLPALAARTTRMPCVPEGARHATLNLNSIHGGQPEPGHPEGERNDIPPSGEARAALERLQIRDRVRSSGFGNARPAPVVADRCRLVLDRRYLIEEDIGGVQGEIIALLERVRAARAGTDFSIREIMRFEPTMTEPDAPVVKALDHWIDHLFGKPATHVASPGTYDQKHITRFGSVRDCVAYGPGILDLAHQPDEWVGISDMIASAKVIAAAMLTLLRQGRN